MKQYNPKSTSFFRHLICTFVICISTIAPIKAQEIIFHNEKNDTTKLTALLIEESKQTEPGKISRIAKKFINTPYCAGTLDSDSIERLQINLEQLDCTTFVETVLALAYTALEKRESWQDFAYNLRRFRYRNGETDGYASRLHYASDWILNNVARGNIKEITGDMPGVKYNVKSLDYMTRHRKQYPHLADSANLVRIRNIEAGFSNHRYPYIKSSALKEKKLPGYIMDGDIIFFTTKTEGLDVSHMAIATVIDNKVRIIHASSKAGKVILDPLTLVEYVKKHNSEGIRVARLAM